MNLKIEPNHYEKGNWILAPLSDITTPKDGRICYGQRYWAVTENNEVLFFKEYAFPQCNPNKLITDRLINAAIADKMVTWSLYIEMAYVPPTYDFLERR